MEPEELLDEDLAIGDQADAIEDDAELDFEDDAEFDCEAEDWDEETLGLEVDELEVQNISREIGLR